jgi:hypothetical protein
MSYQVGRIAHMFEVLDRVALAGLSDEALISAVTTMTQAEAQAGRPWSAWPVSAGT